ncbi:hypothetical protein B0H14DRAFT_3514592 [Mycena olivaceomarginata]|nr:hypothetical protein B0H14DRAFT_3514592 [Mycena olivaceomarginata]
MADEQTSAPTSVDSPAGTAGPAPNPNAALQGQVPLQTQTPNASSGTPNAEGVLPNTSHEGATLSHTASADGAPPNASDANPVPVDTHSDVPLQLGSIISETGEVYTPPPRPVIVKRAREKKARRKSGDPPAKPGKVGWAWGTKLQFFDKRKDEWATTHNEKRAGDFYTTLTKLYLVKYGYHVADDEDFEVHMADPPVWVANKVVNEELAPEESTFRQDYYQKFHEGNGTGTRKPPCRPQLLHFYSEKRYDSHIRPRVEERKRALGQRAEFAGVEAPASIKIQNNVTKECWDEESMAYQEEMVKERERQHDIKLKAWRESNADGPNRTPEEFSASLKSAAHYLQPFVDIIADRYGMCVSILMVGPIGEHGGRIEMRSVHSGKTRGLVEKDWPLHDPKGFTRVQATQAERDARMTEVQELHTTDSITMSVSPGGAPTATVRNPSTNATTSPNAASSGAGTASSGPAGAAPSVSAGAATITPGGSGGGGGGTPEENGRAPAENSGAGSTPANEEDDVQRQVNDLWQRRDAGKWTEELRRAHGAFERGKGWGIEWASLVDRFFDFEATWGYADAGGQITTDGRPKAVEHWIGRARKWEKTVDIGVLGDAKKAGSFVAS